MHQRSAKPSKCRRAHRCIQFSPRPCSARHPHPSPPLSSRPRWAKTPLHPSLGHSKKIARRHPRRASSAPSAASSDRVRKRRCAGAWPRPGPPSLAGTPGPAAARHWGGGTPRQSPGARCCRGAARAPWRAASPPRCRTAGRFRRSWCRRPCRRCGGGACGGGSSCPRRPPGRPPL